MTGASNQTHLQVELVVQVPINLLGITVLPEEPSQHTKSPHPQNFSWQTRLTGTPPLTCRYLRLTSAEPPGVAVEMTTWVTYHILCACPLTWPLVLPLHEIESGSFVAF